MTDSQPFALVTGAAGGIGQALARGFTSAGYRVIGTDRLPRPDAWPFAHYLQVDLTRTVEEPACADAVFAEIRALLNGRGLKALVNNAALQVLGKTEELTRDDWNRTLQVNLLAPFFWVQALLPELELARGSVVNISSIHAALTKRQFVAYATSKAALSGMTRAMAVDLAGRVRVNAVEPAAIETPMLQAGFAGAPEQYAQLLSAHPIGRIGWPDEIAQAAVFLAGDEARFLHGACLGVDGGIRGRLHDPG